MNWVHIKCNKLDKKDYTAYQMDENMTFCCIKCLAETLPLQDLDNNQFDLTSKGIDIPEEINVDDIFLSTTQKYMINKINAAIGRDFDLTDDITDLDPENATNPIDCKYYTIDQFKEQKLNPTKHFSILHLNIHSLEFHIEELRIILKLINFQFDIICISENKIRKNIEPKTDISIEGYQFPVGTPTEATKGGVSMYVKIGIDYKPREDLIIYKTKELESYFIETINKKGKKRYNNRYNRYNNKYNLQTSMYGPKFIHKRLYATCHRQNHK